MPIPLKERETVPLAEFIKHPDVPFGATMTRQMLNDGRLKGFRVGKKKIVIVVSSFFEYLRKQEAQGIGEYEPIKNAHTKRRQQIAVGNRKPGPGPRAAKRQEKLAEAEALCEELGI